MKRNHLHGALLLAAASLLATGAYAQTPTAAPQGKANAAEKAADKAEKTADKAKDALDPAKAKSADDRAARKAKEHDAQRDRLRGMLKAPMTDDLKAELRRHAERVAKLESNKSVAQTEKDTATVEKATKLLAKENERHDKWMAKVSTATVTTGTPGTPAATPTPAAADPKGGAK